VCGGGGRVECLLSAKLPCNIYPFTPTDTRRLMTYWSITNSTGYSRASTATTRGCEPLSARSHACARRNGRQAGYLTCPTPTAAHGVRGVLSNRDVMLSHHCNCPPIDGARGWPVLVWCFWMSFFSIGAGKACV